MIPLSDSLRNQTRKRIKALYLAVRPRPPHQQTLFILGCQRSGTTLLLKIFEQDWKARTYQEQSVLSRPEAALRLREPSQVRRILRASRAPLQVLKPLVESQHARRWLEALPDSRAVWMFRHYRSVARSNLQKFGQRNGIADLRPIVRGETGNWRAEALPEALRAFVQEHFSEQMNPWDAAVLFWYVRNALFFSQNLPAHPRVRLCRYADLVQQPQRIVPELYAWMGLPAPGQRLWRQVRPNARIQPPEFPLSPSIEARAQALWEQLLHAYRAQEALP